MSPFLILYDDMFRVKHETFYQRIVVPIIFKYEGRDYVNDPRDPGGPTKFGWTLKSYKRLIDPKATKESIKNLTESNASLYYKKYFWERYGASKIKNRRLSITLLLAQVNLGPYRPSRILQRESNEFCGSELKEDGILGGKSIKSINNCKYLWPGFPYVLYYFYSNNKKIGPVWKWAKNGLRNRIFYGVNHGKPIRP